MANIKQMKDEALGVVDAALAILDKFPSLDDTNASLSYNTSSNPFEFLMDLFKTTAGYNKVIDILSAFIVFELPAVEMAVKAVLLANIKNLISCSLNPLIPDELLRDGFVFNVGQIDITDTLRYSPLKGYQPPSDNPFKYGEGWDVDSLSAVNYLENQAARKNRNVGSYYYFGCDDCKCADDIPNLPYNPDIFVGYSDLLQKKTKPLDFNALLWYTINRATERQVWGVSEKLTMETESGKHKRENGILTLDYTARPSGLKTADGGARGGLPPFNQCVQVFIGNTQEKHFTDGVSINTLNERKNNINTLVNDIIDLRKRVDGMYGTLTKRQVEIAKNAPDKKTCSDDDKTEWTTNSLVIELLEVLVKQKPSSSLRNGVKNGTADSVFGDLVAAKDKMSALVEEIERIVTELDFENIPRHEKKNDVRTFKYLELCSSNSLSRLYQTFNGLVRKYPDIKQNYYYRRTLIQFNSDYIQSLRLFDSKVIAAQLLDQLTGILHVDLDLSYKELFIREEIRKMVSMVVNTDDAVVSDCFFTFDNAEYADMMHQAEKQRAGLASNRKRIQKDDAKSILASLSEMSDNADPAGQITVVESSLKNALFQGTVTASNNLDTDAFSTKVDFDIISRLLDGLAYVIASAVLSPKVYLLILINLQTLGNATTFDLDKFLNTYKQMIVQIIREVRDLLVQYLVRKLGEILADIAKNVAVKIGLEQAEYYRRLIKKIIACLKRKKGDIDWTMDKIEHADIDPSEEDSIRNEQC